jgi:TetR/AcrR family transcriptional regulator
MAPRKAQRFTATFARLPEDKRRRVLDQARRIFARDGFAGTNVNEIAAGAGISVGALYKYFRTKEDLFLTLIEEAHSTLERVLGGIAAEEGSLLDKIVQIYLDCTTQKLAPLAAKLSRNIETLAATTYRRLLDEAKARGEIPSEVDTAFAAFCLDNLLLIVQFSYGSRYFRERLRVFAGEDAPERKAEVVAGVLAFTRRALGIPAGGNGRRKPRRAGAWAALGK